MASNKTPNLGLDTWAETDYFKRVELNSNFDKIDIKSKENSDQIVDLSQSVNAKLTENTKDLESRGINASSFGAKTESEIPGFDSTRYLQDAINFAENSGIKRLTIPPGVYNINDTLIIQNTNMLHISAYGVKIIANVPDGKSAIEFKTSSIDWWRGRRTILEGIVLTSKTLGVGTGIFINGAQEWNLHNVHIEYFNKGIQLYETWYGGVTGTSSVIGNTIGVDVIGQESNIIDFRNLKINSAGALVGTTRIGVRLNARTLLLKLNYITIEGADIGVQCLYQGPGKTAVLDFTNCYFEAIKVCAIDFSAKSETALVSVEIENCHFAEDSKAAWIKLKSGDYRIYGNNFKKNRILIDNSTTYRINVNTDVPFSQLDFTKKITNGGSLNDGLVMINGRTAEFIDSNAYLYNSKGDYNEYPRSKTHLPSIIDQQVMVSVSPYNDNQMSKIYPVYTVNYKDVVFEQNGVVLKSPDGKYFRVTVDNDGLLKTQNVSTIKESFAPSISSIPMLEVARKETRGGNYVYPEGTKILIHEIGRTIQKTNGLFEDTGNAGIRVFGSGVQAASIAFGVTYYSSYYFNTDIEFFYTWFGSYWAWCGKDKTTQTNIRCVGTLAERPANPAISFMMYYSTDKQAYSTWNGSAWV